MCTGYNMTGLLGGSRSKAGSYNTGYQVDNWTEDSAVYEAVPKWITFNCGIQ